MSEDQNRRILGAVAALAAAGAAIPVGALVLQGIPRPLWLLAVLAVTFVVLDNASVEIGDGLYLSSSAMVLFTAAVVFGRDHALAAVGIMGLCTLLQSDVVRKGRWGFAVINTGQIVVSSGIAIGLLSVLMPAEVTGRGDVGHVAAAALAAAVVYPWVNLGLVAVLTRWLFPERPEPTVRQQLRNNLALTVLGVLGGLLGAVYVLGGAVALPLLLVTYVVGHVGFRADAQMREAHEATIKGLVRSLEALDPYSRGHAERVVLFSAWTAARLDLDQMARDRLRWAGFVHDIGKVAVPPEILRHSGAPTESDQDRMVRMMATVESILADVDFLAPVIEIVQARHAILTGAARGPQPMESRILAAADMFDGLTSARSYRAAVTQEQAFAELRAMSVEFGGEVVEALIAAVESSGEMYGSPDAAAAAAVEHLVRERAARG